MVTILLGAAYDAYNALKDKISDYFMRCRLLAFDPVVAESVSVSVTDIASVADCPLAKPSMSGLLPFNAINPAWQAAFDKVQSLVLGAEFDGREGLTAAEWDLVAAKFNAYAAWLADKKGCEVESLGIDRIRVVLADNYHADLLELVASDVAVKAEADSIDDVKKLMCYYRDFYRFLKNFVLFTDFYSRAPGVRAMFELGQLYIDQRCCDLCIRVADMSKHADMAKLSGIFLIYFRCTSKELGRTMDAVAVMTDGDIDDLRPGKNGIFYDLHGNAWEAVITKIVDNPVSVKQAFWAPYRKAWEFCVGLINKSAAEKDAKINADLQSKVQSAAIVAPADGAADANKKQPFDIAKFVEYLCCHRHGIGIYRVFCYRCHFRCEQYSSAQAFPAFGVYAACDFRSFLFLGMDESPQAQSRPYLECQRLGYQLQGSGQYSFRWQADQCGQVPEIEAGGSVWPENSGMEDMAPDCDSRSGNCFRGIVFN